MSNLITAGVSVSGMVRNLANVFSTGNTFISELIQNSRRAGATEIHVMCTEDTNNSVHIMVSDNGAGIEDFQKLLMLAESGWDSDVKEKESPFGMGFFSALLAGEETSILSKGKMLKVSRNDLLEGKSFSLVDAPQMQGTTICITKRFEHGDTNSIRLSVGSLLNRARKEASWINARVTVNGVEAEHAVYDFTQMQDSDNHAVLNIGQNGELGVVHLNLNSPYLNCWVYLSDGSIIANSESYHKSYEAPIKGLVAQINPKQLKMRMPDREQFVDHTESIKVVHLATAVAIVNRFKKDIKELGEMAAYKKWQGVIGDTTWGSFSDMRMAMLNELSFIPRRFISKPSEIDPIGARCSNATNPEEGFVGVTRQQIESGEVCAVDQHWGRIYLAIAKAMNWYAVDGTLFKNHWIKAALLKAGNPTHHHDERFVKAIESIESVNVLSNLYAGWYHHNYIVADSYKFLWEEDVIDINFSFRCYDNETVWLTSMDDIDDAVEDERECSDAMSESDADDFIAEISSYFRSIGKKNAHLLRAALDTATLNINEECKAVFINGKLFNIKSEFEEEILKMLEPIDKVIAA